MKIIIRLLFEGVLVCSLFVAHAFAGTATLSQRDISPLDADWRFHLGDDADAAKAAFNDSSWRHVDVPHDYVVEGPFDPTPQPDVKAEWYNLHGNKPVQAAWYRKTFNVPVAAKGKRVWLEFDGVFSNSRYWLNDHEIGSQYSGYVGSRFDVTDTVNFGGDNLLSVKVDPKYDGWWYEGGGIYRHVRMVVVDPVHIVPDGVFAAATLEDPKGAANANATVVVSTEVANQTDAAVSATVVSEILNADNKVVATEQTILPVAPSATATEMQNASLKMANLWSLEKPYLYELRTTVKISDKTADVVTTHFGVRHVRFDPDHGFFLNGKHVEIQGVDAHQDHAGVGIAVPDRLIAWRLERLKEMGCNAWRLSHNPVAPVTLDDCDRMGIMVLAENRHLGDTYADQTPKDTPSIEHRDLSFLIKRDRNHPSIILWSLCNEQWTQGSPEGAAIARAMKHRVNELDGTRPVTAAMNGGYNSKDGFASVLDVVGINYNPWVYPKFHAMFPKLPMVGTEIASEVGTRGIYDITHWDNYFGDKTKCYMSAYSVNAGPGGNTVETAWPPVVENAYMAGAFVWTGFDYKGEPRPFGWPRTGSDYGFMDICGFPKDSYYYYKAWWTNEPVLHILPHWNWPADKVGQEIPVWVQTNCSEVELFLNGFSQGKQTVKPLHHVEWKVKYAPGTLLAKGLRDGKIISATVETTGELAGVRLTADRTKLAADNVDLAVITVQIVDAAGRVVPTADNPITFTLTGHAKLIGLGNGDPSSHEPDKGNQRSAFNGLAQAIVQTTGAAGEIVLTAESPGLKRGSVTFTSK